MLTAASMRYLRYLLPALGLVVLMLLAGCGITYPSGTGALGAGNSPAPTAVVGTIVKTAQGQYTDLTADELKAMMDHKDFFLVDVHVPHEGRMPQLDARIPYDQIANHLDQLPADKLARIVLVCKGGGMSKVAAVTLVGLGYTNVYNLVGGFLDWKAKGYAFTPEP
jgi:rhodanese-related sulfurtransferase